MPPEMLEKVLFAFAAIVGAVNAQRNPCIATSTTIQSSSDLEVLQTCTTLTGDLVLGPDLVLANIIGIQTIEGDLIVENAVDIRLISAPDLTTIGGKFQLTSLIGLFSLSFPSLRSVGEIDWLTLPALNNLDFSTSVALADAITISDTNLKSLDGINPATVQRLNINNNKYMREINIQLANVTENLVIEFNSPSIGVSLPNLVWTNNATFRSCGSLQLPSLAVVNGSLGFFENTVETLSLPSVTGIGTGTDGGDLVFLNNNNLSSISMPLLETIFGSLDFSNNSNVRAITGFPELSVVHGSIEITGEFDTAEFPSVTDILGGFNLETTGEFNCDELEQLEAVVVRGSYNCQGASTSTETSGTTGSGNTGDSDPNTNGGDTGGGNGSGGLSGGAIAGIAVGVAVPLIAVGLYLGYRFGRRSNGAVEQEKMPAPPPPQLYFADGGAEPGVLTQQEIGGIQGTGR
ncbi:hypothetical protein ABW19_dt0205981 [Dactylella cylindrospora]|nr:hypothetical protein ABW19_dt0205981 [Dactylella cylindrospora]